MASRSFQLINNVDTASKIKHRVDELQIIYVFPTKKMPPQFKGRRQNWRNPLGRSILTNKA